ncbi:HRDC domain-containing protein [Gordonia sp. CPCC 205333]|uniref:HRDC domain-containing protein n=1 Tax=Gordonia sp. CPCC 205333 TaxID=3140790 RepID=UPI003AF3D68F
MATSELDNADGDTADGNSVDAEAPAPTPLPEPRDGVPPVLLQPGDFADAATKLAAGSGPIAVDTERASGYKYSARAYLIQLRRTGSGSFLIDPIEHPEALGPIIDALDGPEWILHAADQDLPCLRELDFHCATLYDTELAGRLLGLPRVNLAAMIAHFLGLGLAKGHGAADWSRRPLPADWLNYAALDVEVLVELRDAIADELAATGKSEWAAQEFAYILSRPPSPPRTDRWRRTSNIHSIKTQRGLAVVRELWSAREEMAARRDIAPGRILPDSAIVTAATANPKSMSELTGLPVFGGPRQKRQASLWWSAINRARELPDAELPPKKTAQVGLPAVNRWDQRNPPAAARAAVIRPAIKDLAQEHNLPVENLLAPELVRQICWTGVAGDITTDAVDAALTIGDARPWQRELTAETIAVKLRETAG